MQWPNMCGNIIARANPDVARACEVVDKAVGVAFPRAQMRKFLVTSALALLAIATGKAGVEQPAERRLTQESDSVFNKGAKEFQNVTGVNYFIDRGKRPALGRLRAR